MTIDDFDQLPTEGDLGFTPARPGVVNLVLAFGAAAACGMVATVIVLLA